MFNIEDLEIQPLTTKYYDENLDLLNSVIRESHFLAQKNEISNEESRQFIDTYFEHPNTIYLIALYKQKLIGHISSIPRSEGRLSHIVNIGYIVHSNFRKKGVASRLMENLIIEAKEKSTIKIMVAEVAADNIASINLLKKYDFNEFGCLFNGLMKKEEEFVDFLYFSKYLYEK
ncbi:MAG: GNAT family N-acetyltransferase [Candidatus Hodarchaeota archaeon]